MIRSLALASLAAAILSGCGGAEKPEFENSTTIDTWQTYSASPEGGTHVWSSETYRSEYSIEKLPRISSDFHSGFAFVSEGNLILHNLATQEQYSVESSGTYIKLTNRVYVNGFQTQAFYFSHDYQRISACRKYRDQCKHVEILNGSYPFVYAEARGKVLAITNWGDALVFDGFNWCRMSRSANDVFRCSPTQTMVTQPRAIQFYSSIHYKGHTLLGEWPTGSVYEFDGETLAPSAVWTPPQFLSREMLGYEAQTMAEYCGDLFVGFWPRGEIWRFDGHDQVWKYFKRLFTDTTPEQFIPYFSREPDNLNSAFFGQRVTALVPYQDGLYATTSSLTVWSPDIRPTFLNSDQLDEYGSIYKIYREGCQTVYDKFDDYGA